VKHGGAPALAQAGEMGFDLPAKVSIFPHNPPLIESPCPCGIESIFPSAEEVSRFWSNVRLLHGRSGTPLNEWWNTDNFTHQSISQNMICIDRNCPYNLHTTSCRININD
jgi:hypothetical protein